MCPVWSDRLPNRNGKFRQNMPILCLGHTSLVSLKKLQIIQHLWPRSEPFWSGIRQFCTSNTKFVTICDILWHLWRSQMITLWNLWPRSWMFGFFSISSETNKVWPNTEWASFCGCSRFILEFDRTKEETSKLTLFSFYVCIPDRTYSHTFESVKICDNHRCHINPQMVTNLVWLLPFFKNLWKPFNCWIRIRTALILHLLLRMDKSGRLQI